MVFCLSLEALAEEGYNDVVKKNIFILMIVFVGILVVLVIKNQKIEPNEQKVSIESVKTLKIGDATLNIEVADTDAKRVQGLSGKVGLAQNEAMLFVFDAEGYHSIWMKDMNFAIDIVWLNKDKKIIYIEKNVSPDTYPKVFYAKKADLPILSFYVLETPSGFLAENNIQIGDIVAF